MSGQKAHERQFSETRFHQVSILPALAMMVMAAAGGAALVGHHAMAPAPTLEAQGTGQGAPAPEVLALAAH